MYKTILQVYKGTLEIYWTRNWCETIMFKARQNKLAENKNNNNYNNSSDSEGKIQADNYYYYCY